MGQPMGDAEAPNGQKLAPESPAGSAAHHYGSWPGAWARGRSSSISFGQQQQQQCAAHHDGSSSEAEKVARDGDGEVASRRRSTASSAGFGEFLRQSTADKLPKYDEDPVRMKLHVLLESSAVKLLVGLATVASFVGVVKDTDLRASGDPVPDWLNVMEYILFAVFALELAVRFYVERLAALRSLYTIADIVVVFTAAAEYALVASGVDAGLSKVKALRLARMMKLVRVVYRVPFFVELRKLMYMISSCMKTLFWSFLVLGVVMTMWAIVAVELIHPRVVELVSQGEWSGCDRCSRAFSTVFHANITFFQTIVAGDSWGLMSIPVIEAHPWSALIFTGATLSLVFGVLNVIVAVVVDAFAEARSKDVFTRARELEWEEVQEKKSLATIFRQIDKSGNGLVDIGELKLGARKVQQFSHWLRVLDIDANDLENMFEMLDRDGNNGISSDAFVEWMYRMKNTDSKTATQFSKQKLVTLESKMDALLRRQSTSTTSGGEADEGGAECGGTESQKVQARVGKQELVQERSFESQLSEVSKLLAQSLQRSESLHRGIEEGLAEVRRHVQDSLSAALSPRDVLPAAVFVARGAAAKQPGHPADASVPPSPSSAPLLLSCHDSPVVPGVEGGRDDHGSAEGVGPAGRTAASLRNGTCHSRSAARGECGEMTSRASAKRGLERL